MYRRRFKKKEAEKYPDTIEGFGYIVKENGAIRSKETDEKYNFDYHDDRPRNELRYAAFINLIGDLVEEKLQAPPFNFQKAIIPMSADPAKDPFTYIYMTPKAMTTTDKLLFLIPGNNTRIGQWSKRVMCDETIFSGSMLDVSRRAIEKGYEIMILNPNGIYWYDNKAWEMPPTAHMNFITVPENGSPEEHCRYVLHNFIGKSKARRIVAITLGWGGYNLTEMLNADGNFFKERVLAVAMADSTHSSDLVDGDDRRSWMRDHVVNWAVSTETARGKPLNDNRFGCECLSSGLEISDFTLPTCIDLIWRFIDLKMGDLVLTEADQVDDEIISEEDREEEGAELDEHLNVVSIG